LKAGRRSQYNHLVKRKKKKPDAPNFYNSKAWTFHHSTFVLKALLFALGIKGAETSMFEEMSIKIASQCGQADMIYMNPRDYEALRRTLGGQE